MFLDEHNKGIYYCLGGMIPDELRALKKAIDNVDYRYMSREDIDVIEKISTMLTKVTDVIGE